MLRCASGSVTQTSALRCRRWCAPSACAAARFARGVVAHAAATGEVARTERTLDRRRRRGIGGLRRRARRLRPLGVRRSASASGAVATMSRGHGRGGATERMLDRPRQRIGGCAADVDSTSVNSCIGPAAPARRLRPIGVRRPAGANGAAGFARGVVLRRATATGELARTERVLPATAPADRVGSAFG